MTLPKLPLSAPFCQPGMGEQAAYHSGYVHGYQGVVTRHICTCTAGSAEFAEWNRGYTDGERDASL